MSKNTPATVQLDLLLEELSKFPAKNGLFTKEDIIYAVGVVSRLPKPRKTTKTKDDADNSSSDESKTSDSEAKVSWNDFKKKRNAELKTEIPDAKDRATQISKDWEAYKLSNGVKTKAKTPKKSKEESKEESKVETKEKPKKKSKEEPKVEAKVETKVAELKAIENDMSDDEFVDEVDDSAEDSE